MKGYELYREWLRDHDEEYVEQEVAVNASKAEAATSVRSEAAWLTMKAVAESVLKGKRVRVRA